MSTTLKKTITSTNVENDNFIGEKDRHAAQDLYLKYNLQTIFETVSEYLKDGKFLPGYDKYLTVSRALVHNAPDSWILEFIRGFSDATTSSVCLTSLKSLTKMAGVEPYTGEDKEFDSDDFKDVPYRGYLVLSCLDQFLKRLVKLEEVVDKSETFKFATNVTYFCMLLIALHHDKQLWTSTHTNTLAQSLQTDLLAYWSLADTCDLLVFNLQHIEHYDKNDIAEKKVSILGKLLEHWKPNLLRQTWKKNPTTASSFAWCLKHLKFPHTSEFLELILPPSLLFADDYMGANKILGVKCMIHIMETAGAEELRWYGRADVIYEALKFQMYRTEEDLMRLTIQALLLVLKIVAKNADELCTRTRYDDIFLILLQNASHENKLALRRVHTEHLHVFIECLGINAVKYLKQVIDLADEYLEISDVPEEIARINMMKALISLIQTAWPRIQPYITRIIKILMKLLYRINSKVVPLDSRVKENVTDLIYTILSLLKALDDDLVTKSLSSLRSLPFPTECLTFVNKVLG